jgi:DNA-nicking Smr family endonuclease
MDNPSVGTEMVEIVTGRGNRSEGGKAKIKPAVKKRLEQRDVRSVSDLLLNAL